MRIVCAKIGRTCVKVWGGGTDATSPKVVRGNHLYSLVL